MEFLIDDKDSHGFYRYARLIDGTTIASVDISEAEDQIPSLWSFRVIPRSEQGKGYGTKLMKLVTDKLREEGNESVKLWVYKDNERAINLYKRLGFDITDDGKDKTTVEATLKLIK